MGIRAPESARWRAAPAVRNGWPSKYCSVAQWRSQPVRLRSIRTCGPAYQGVPGKLKEMANADRRFGRAAWGVLAYNILVVLWGAFVRATGSGAGCGDHWPLCNGAVVPRAPRIETLIEFTHRVTSGLALVSVIALCIWAFRRFPRGHRARLFAALSVVFLFAEALLGAGLVLLRYVEQNASAGRAAYLSAHLVNTQVLLAMLALTAWFGSGERKWRGAPKVVIAALPVAVIVAVSGAIAALGDTLFPAASVAAGMRQEFSSAAGALLRLRVLHPALATAAAVLLLAAAVAARRTGIGGAVRAGSAAAVLVFAQLGLGVLNIALLAPVWMQLVHLLAADLMWVALVVMALEAGRAQ
jgi:cytochrome c oxidase assembly protein subunit 15